MGGTHPPQPISRSQNVAGDLAESMSQHVGVYWLWDRKKSHHPYTLTTRTPRTSEAEVALWKMNSGLG